MTGIETPIESPPCAVGDHHLPGITVWLWNDGKTATFIENRKGQFLAVCPDCEHTYWYRVNDSVDDHLLCEHEKALRAT